MCEAVCPTGCISTEFNGTKLELKIDKEKCVHCGNCLKVCSASEVQKYDNTPIEEYLAGNIKQVLKAKCKDNNLLENSTSGGAVTGLVKTLLEKKIYDCAFLVEGYNYDEHLNTKRFVKGDNLTETAKSRYLTVSHSDTIKYMKEHPDEKIILVGTPCAITSFKNYIEMKKLDKSKYLLLGLFCDKTMHYGVKEYFAQHKASRGKILDKLFFRTKKDCGWPGDMNLVYKDGSDKMLSNKERMKVKSYFVPERCLYCLDKLNKNSDIAFGDNYIKNNADKSGVSSVVIRTEQGNNDWTHAQELFEISTDSIEDLVLAQGLEKKSINIEFAKAKGLLKGNTTSYTLDKYKEALRKIKLGLSNKNLYKIIKRDIKRNAQH